MRNLLLLFLLMFNLAANSQIDSVLSKRICNKIGINENEFFVDTVLKVDQYEFYGITPWPGGYSYFFCFKNDSLIEISDFQNSNNRIPFEFNLYELNGSKFIATYCYSESVSKSSIDFVILSLNDFGIDKIFNTIIYYNDKQHVDNKSLLEINSLCLIEGDNKIQIEKISNCDKTCIYLEEKYGLNLSLPRKYNKCKVRMIEHFNLTSIGVRKTL